MFVLITMSLSTHFASQHPKWTSAEHYLFGIMTSLLFFSSVVLHELGHSVIAQNYGIAVKSITLFVFGGVAQMAREPERPVQEFNIAIAGPVVSAALGAGFHGLSVWLPSAFEGIVAQAQWLGRINLTLAVFNLIPGFPLDGGRVLRAVIWGFTGSFQRATAAATGAGQSVAYIFIMIGISIGLTGNFVGGLWIAFIGWFLLNAAQSTAAQAKLKFALAGIKAGDVMTTDYLRIPRGISIAELVENFLLKHGVRCCMVLDGDRFSGLVTLQDIRLIDWALFSRP